MAAADCQPRAQGVAGSVLEQLKNPSNFPFDPHPVPLPARERAADAERLRVRVMVLVNPNKDYLNCKNRVLGMDYATPPYQR
jgi:hypothetical protein